jgi:hypothetical protein
MDAIGASIAGWLLSAGNPESLVETYSPFVRCACKYKHWGFQEEKEVRIVLIPPNAEVLATRRQLGLCEKPLHHFVRSGTLVPCYHLFEGIARLPDWPLPITRIIVGPSNDQEIRKLGLLRLIGELNVDVMVSSSEIPYVER